MFSLLGETQSIKCLKTKIKGNRKQKDLFQWQWDQKVERNGRRGGREEGTKTIKMLYERVPIPQDQYNHYLLETCNNANLKFFFTVSSTKASSIQHDNTSPPVLERPAADSP